MTAPDFATIVDSLRQELIEYYRTSGERLAAASWHNTLETNSGFVERRADPLLELLARGGGPESLEGLRVADLGCGFGALAVFFAAHGAVVRGIDPNANRLVVGRNVARRHGLDVELQPGRMEAVPLDDGDFDLVVENNSLCYVVEREDRARALGETWRILRPHGHVLVRNPNRLALLDQFTGLPGVHMLPPSGADRAARMVGRSRSRVRLLSNRGARAELRRAGFVSVRALPSPDSKWPGPAHRFARYQHLVAQRPAGPRRG